MNAATARRALKAIAGQHRLAGLKWSPDSSLLDVRYLGAVIRDLETSAPISVVREARLAAWYRLSFRKSYSQLGTTG